MFNKILSLIKVLAISVLLLLFLIGAMYMTRKISKEIHEPIGYNMGVMNTSIEILNRIIKNSDNIPLCLKDQQIKEKLFITSNEKSIFITDINGNILSLCQFSTKKLNG